jgi:hypothetical protein
LKKASLKKKEKRLSNSIKGKSQWQKCPVGVKKRNIPKAHRITWVRNNYINTEK